MNNVTSIPYQPNKRKVTQLMTGGFVASLAVIVGSWLLSIFNLQPRFMETLASWYEVTPISEAANPQIFGFLGYLLIGVVLLPFVFDYMVHRKWMGSDKHIKALSMALILWAGLEMIVKPVLGLGFFSRDMLRPVAAVIASGILSLLYSYTLSGMLRTPVVHQVRLADGEQAQIQEQQAA